MSQDCDCNALQIDRQFLCKKNGRECLIKRLRRHIRHASRRVADHAKRLCRLRRNRLLQPRGSSLRIVKSYLPHCLASRNHASVKPLFFRIRFLLQIFLCVLFDPGIADPQKRIVTNRMMRMIRKHTAPNQILLLISLDIVYKRRIERKMLTHIPSFQSGSWWKSILAGIPLPTGAYLIIKRRMVKYLYRA